MTYDVRVTLNYEAFSMLHFETERFTISDWEKLQRSLFYFTLGSPQQKTNHLIKSKLFHRRLTPLIILLRN